MPPSPPGRADRSDRTPPRRIGGGRLAGLFALLLLGAAAFLLLLDVVYNQDDPVAPWFTDQMSETVATSILVAVMAVALIGEVALLLPRRAAPEPWSPGVTCLECGAWVDRPTPQGTC